jgi:hypothetical protein
MRDDASMADKRAYLHVGLHKTGTTYLQNLLRANRDALRDQGVEYLADESVSQRLATRDLKSVTSRRGYDDPRIPGAWDRLVAGIELRGAPTVLISDEGLGGSRSKQIARAVSSLPSYEAHVVVTVRDIGRVLVSQWQEQVKNDRTWTWDDYVAAVRSPDRAEDEAARGFWSRQDVIAILARWEREVPPDRIHVVTVPPRGAAPEELLRRFASVVGFEPDRLPNSPRRSNESVGAAGTEVIRRVNERLGGRLNEPAYSRAVKAKLAPVLAARADVGRLVLPAEHLEWAQAHADDVIARLSKAGYAIEGDLEDLRVRADADGRAPDEFTSDELVEASLDSLAAIVEGYATSWWSQREQEIERQRPATAGPRSAVSVKWTRLRRRAVRATRRTRFGRRALARFRGERPARG